MCSCRDGRVELSLWFATGLAITTSMHSPETSWVFGGRRFRVGGWVKNGKGKRGLLALDRGGVVIFTLVSTVVNAGCDVGWHI